MIKISTEKTVNGENKCGYYVKDLEALEFEALPRGYFSKKESFILRRKWFAQPYNLKLCKGYGCPKETKAFINVTPSKTDAIGYHHNNIIIRTHWFYTADEFSEILEFIRSAGENLKEVNKNIKSLHQEWQGEETFII